MTKMFPGESDVTSNSFDSQRKGLVLAATFWGVVGYAIGTTIGVAVSKVLLLSMKM